jgi:PKD repeat protein
MMAYYCRHGAVRRDWFAVGFLVLNALCLTGSTAFAQQGTVFYESLILARDTGTPQEVTDSFVMDDVEGDFRLVVENGDLVSEQDQVSSALVYLNGVVVLATNDFNKRVKLVEKPVALLPTNELAVELRGKPGTFIKVSIVGQLWNRRPLALAGADVNALLGGETRLDGTGSYDPDGDLITFSWSPFALPSTSGAILDDNTSPRPNITPDVPGDYTYELVVNDGEVSSTPDYVTVSAAEGVAAPNANAGRDQAMSLGETAHLDGSWSSDPNDLPLTFAWTFLDVPPSSLLQDVDILYGDTAKAEFSPDVVGTYRLGLTVGNGVATDADSMDLLVLQVNVPPNADAGPDTVVKLGDEVVLDGSASRDPDSAPAPLTEAWRLVAKPGASALTSADIVDADQSVARLTPDVEGTYVARIQVNDGQSQDGDNTSVFADGASPSLIISSPADGATVDTTTPTINVEFNDAETGVDLDSFQLVINGADVTAATMVKETSASYTPLVNLPGGDNEVTARIEDTAGNLGEDTNAFAVSIFRAVADCGPTVGTAPHTVRYRTRGQFTGGSIVRYRWDRDGNGSYDTSDSIPRDYTYTFDAPGTYNAILEVLNNFGETATDVCTIAVEQEGPIATATASPSNGPVPLEVTLICQGQAPNGAIVLWEWDFDGDGTFDHSSAASGTTSHTYDTVGEFAARCRVTDSAGLTGVSGEINTTVRPRPPGSPSVTATASPTSGAASLAVNLSGSVTGGGAIVLYEWDFDGDGIFDYSSNTSPAVRHIYQAGGIFAATLRVTNDLDLTSLDSIAIAVNVTASLLIPDDTFLPYAGEKAIVRTTLSGDVPARVLIRNKAGINVRTLVDEARAAGTYHDSWDGRNDEGDLLPDGDYYAVLEYEVAGQTARIDLTDTTGGSRYNPSRSRLPSRFSPFENDSLPITFIVPSTSGASEVLAFVGLFNTNTRLVTLADREPFGVGTHSIYWDGLLPDGSFAVPPPGDTFLFGIWGYTLPNNAIYLSSAPRISNFAVQPTLHSPARDGSRPFHITFDLDKDADLELTVVNLATGGVVFTGRFPGFTAGAGKHFEWTGLNSDGQLPDKGEYRLALTAIDGSGGTSLTRYMLLRVFY